MNKQKRFFAFFLAAAFGLLSVSPVLGQDIDLVAGDGSSSFSIMAGTTDYQLDLSLMNNDLTSFDSLLFQLNVAFAGADGANVTGSYDATGSIFGTPAFNTPGNPVQAQVFGTTPIAVNSGSNSLGFLSLDVSALSAGDTFTVDFNPSPLPATDISESTGINLVGIDLPTVNVTVASIPEPGSITVLMLTGLVVISSRRRR